VVLIDEGKCAGCGSCVKICHQHCLELAGGKVRLQPDTCSTCGQCIAACPERALSWDGQAPLPFAPENLPTPEQLEELFGERHSVRDFKPEPLPRSLVERIAASGAQAPTNNYALRVVATDDPEVIRQLDQAVVRFSAAVYRWFFRPRLVFRLLRRLTPGMTETDKVKIQSVLARGQNFRSFPAAMLFVTGDRRTALSLESAQCALANMYYAAQVLGVASCLFGPGRIVLDRSASARRRLGLGPQERILGTLLLGWPAVRFRNRVRGRQLPLRWV
jgi:NAD-dependent dihydropyrimidine dehydrogenase PreA subunit/nitroreductase